MLLTAVLLSLLAGPSVAASSNNPEVYYSIHYAGGGCETRVGGDSSAVSVKGYVAGESYEVFGPPASDNVTCLDAIPCQVDRASSADCTVEHNFTHTVDAGQVVNPESPGYNMSECHIDSDWYGDCNWLYKTLDEIKAEPELLLGDYSPDLEARNEFIYLAFYEDDSCTDLATVVTSLSGQTLSVPKAMNNPSLTCAEASLCAVDPAAGICADRVDGEDTVNLDAITRPASSNVYQCDGSNEDVGQEECNEYTPTDCIKSSLYANCHFRYLSGDVLGMNPRLLLGETTEPVETTAPPEPVVAASKNPEVCYSINYAGEGCETLVGGDSSAVSVKGYVTGENYEGFGPPPSDNMTCLEAIPCQVDPFSSDDCTVEHNFTIDVVTGQLVLVEPESPGYNLSECHIGGDWFGDCNWVYKTLDEIKAELELLLGDYSPDLEARDEFIYLAFYEDDSCTDLATIVTSLSGQTLSVPKAMNNPSLTCAEASLCAVDPAAGICADRVDGEDTVNLDAITRPASSNVYQCDASNEDVGQEECNEYTPTDCIKSSLYANCHFRYLSGDVLGMNPRLLLGETTEPVETTAPPETVDSSSSFALVADSRWLWTTVFATVAVIVA